jgi:hypothetical protein
VALVALMRMVARRSAKRKTDHAAPVVNRQSGFDVDAGGCSLTVAQAGSYFLSSCFIAHRTTQAQAHPPKKVFFAHASAGHGS